MRGKSCEPCWETRGREASRARRKRGGDGLRTAQGGGEGTRQAPGAREGGWELRRKMRGDRRRASRRPEAGDEAAREPGKEKACEGKWKTGTSERCDRGRGTHMARARRGRTPRERRAFFKNGLADRRGRARPARRGAAGRGEAREKAAAAAGGASFRLLRLRFRAAAGVEPLVGARGRGAGRGALRTVERCVVCGRRDAAFSRRCWPISWKGEGNMRRKADHSGHTARHLFALSLGMAGVSVYFDHAFRETLSSDYVLGELLDDLEAEANLGGAPAVESFHCDDYGPLGRQGRRELQRRARRRGRRHTRPHGHAGLRGHGDARHDAGALRPPHRIVR